MTKEGIETVRELMAKMTAEDRAEFVQTVRCVDNDLYCYEQETLEHNVKTPKKKGYKRRAYRTYELDFVEVFENSPSLWACREKPTATELAKFLGRTTGSLCEMQKIVRRKMK